MSKKQTATTQNLETSIAIALGKTAFETGKKAVPAHDASCMKMLEGRELGDGTHILMSWLLGWHTANAQA